MYEVNILSVFSAEGSFYFKVVLSKGSPEDVEVDVSTTG